MTTGAIRRALGFSGKGHLTVLDGVRGLGLPATVFYHAGVSWVPGGLLGVDIFFVLSGYLITGLLLTEKWRTGRISLRMFWIRRAHRLLPALLVVIAVVVIVWRVTAPAVTLESLRGDALATLFYSANWHFAAAGQGYFASFAEPSPLLHMWSLGVEEQFYLIWPLIVVSVLGWRIVRPGGTKRLFAVAIVGALASAALMGVLESRISVGSAVDESNSLSRIYYGTDTRLQMILVGAALVLGLRLAGRDLLGRRIPAGVPIGAARRRDTPTTPDLARGPRIALTIAGCLALLAVIVMVLTVEGQSEWLYHGGYLMFACLVGLVIASIVLVPRSPLVTVLAAPPLVFLGRISYGAYLWHFPVDRFLTGERTGVDGLGLLTVRLSATVALALASLVLVEVPIRCGRVRIPRPGVAVPVGVGGLAALLLVTPLPRSQQSDLLSLDDAGNPGPPPSFAAATVPLTQQFGTPQHPLRVLLIGDSIAWSMGRGMDLYAAGDQRFVFTNQGIKGCGIARGGMTSWLGGRTQSDRCMTWPQQYQTIADIFRPDVSVLTVGRWETFARIYKGHWVKPGDPAYDAYLKREFDLALRVLTSHGGRVMITTCPCFNMIEGTDGSIHNDDGVVVRFNEIVRQVVAAHPGTGALDLRGMVCPGGVYHDTLRGVTIREIDRIHITVAGGQLIAPEFFGDILDFARHEPLTRRR